MKDPEIWPPWLVRIRAQQGNEEGVGAGLLIAPDLVLTAWHVVNVDGKYRGTATSGGTPMAAARIDLEIGGKHRRSIPTPHQRHVSFADKPVDDEGQGRDYDLALVRLEEDPVPIDSGDLLPIARGVRRLEYLALGDLGPDEPFQVVGFPGGSLRTKRFDDGAPDPERAGDEFYEVHLGHRVPEGYSGGPILAEVDGQALCLGLASLGGATVGSSVQTFSGAIIEFLDQQKVLRREGDRLQVPTEDLGRLLLRRPLECIAERNDRLPPILSRSARKEWKLHDLFQERIVVDRAATGGGDSDGNAKAGGLRELVDWTPTVDSPPRWVLRGAGGTGKTTLLRHLAFELAREANQAGDGAALPPVAIFLRLPLIVRRGPDWRAALFDELRDRVDRAAILTRALSSRVSEPRILLLLDGLDEVDAGEVTENTISLLLQGLPDHLPGVGLVVGTRPTGFDDREPALTRHWNTASVEPLDRDHQIRLVTEVSKAIGRPCSEKATAAWVHQISRDERFADIRGNPLWLTLAALAVDPETGAPPPSMSGLLAKAVDHLVMGMHRGDLEPRARRRRTPVAGPIPSAARPVLGTIALAMTLQRQDELRFDDLVEVCKNLRKRADHDVRGSDELWARLTEAWELLEDDSEESILDQLSLGTDILSPLEEDGEQVEDGGSDADELWSFRHRTVKEFLSADQLRRMLEGDDAPHAQQLIEAGLDADLEGSVRHWAGPAALLVEMLDDATGAERVLRCLAPRDPEAARRALLGRPNATVGSIHIVLASLEKEGDRAAVIEQIDRLIEDRQEAFDLLRSLGLDPRIRADLYFVDEALLAFGVRHEDLADEADAARLRIYEELPVEPTWRAPFERTFGDPGVPLWRPVTRHLTFGYGDRELEQVTEQPFQISAVPVTEEMYRIFDPHDDQRKSEPGLLPARSVSWWGAMAFCRWAGAKLGFGLAGSLPTERQWECAARAGTESDYWFGPEALDEHGWYGQNSESRAHDVATRPPNGDRPQQPNPNGLFDVHGNVWEWCVDLFGRDGPRRVLRGGCFWYAAASCRSGFRYWDHPADRDRLRGFRVVLPADLR
ncbi:SUMF1/EgtB/PvdO family nonheme iron enzyme [Engelhardtia mirabilis]|uniref:Serine/threonine-protein kinase pkn1 n=1 Tax=Engelhardtia mirabilis TaxID=2528011 RepID=A0A518BKZ5_9BACT|nr:Serine/threonine-protein kinase pkn1 [Planctomycetes bacterium Pla133]QDV01971.1 Serine/threonine-protein kinase pkn1 [Planctomycetes bacterium Pla86]